MFYSADEPKEFGSGLSQARIARCGSTVIWCYRCFCTVTSLTLVVGIPFVMQQAKTKGNGINSDMI